MPWTKVSGRSATVAAALAGVLLLAARPADRPAPADLVLKVLWKRARPTQPGLRLVGDEDRLMRFLGSRLTA